MQQTIGASGLTRESPVTIPTFSVPKMCTRSKNFSLTSALIGAVYQDRSPRARAAACAATATSDLPVPVGVDSTTWRSRTISSTASSCAG